MGHKEAATSAGLSLGRFVDEHRSRCLWFLRADYYPVSPAECEQVLRYIERYGDLQAFRDVARMRAWLSHHFNETSAGF